MLALASQTQPLLLRILSASTQRIVGPLPPSPRETNSRAWTLTRVGTAAIAAERCTHIRKIDRKTLLENGRNEK